MTACSAIVDNDKTKLGAMPIPCEVGQSAICPCPDGSQSTQVCNNSARYDPCMCRGVSAARAGQGAAAVSGAGGRAGASAGSGSGGRAGAAGR